MSSLSTVATTSSQVDYVKQELQNRFSAEVYPQVKANHKEFVFHFLMPRQSDEAILKWLATCNEKYAAYINKPDTMEIDHIFGKDVAVHHPTALTPLSMAALIEREAIVEALCNSKGIDCEITDNKGWIPLQHAIARNNPRIIAKIEATMDQTADKASTTAAQKFSFLRSLLKSQIPQGEDVVARYRDERGTVQALTQNQFQEMNGGAQFFDGIIATPNALFRNWKLNTIAVASVTDYEQWLKNKPALLLIKEKDFGFGVVADEALNKGDLVTLYGAELTSPEKFNEARVSVYSYQDSTGEWVRNWGSIVNDGFPNMGALPLSIDGVNLNGMICLENIKQGEEFFHNYGYGHSVKWGPRCEPAMQKIRERYPTSESLLKEMRPLHRSIRNLSKNNTAEGWNKVISEAQGLIYLLHTPSTLLSLIIRNHFDLASVQEIVNDKGMVSLALLDKPKGEVLKKIYHKMFQLIRLFNSVVKNQEIREAVAKKFEENVRAGGAALAMVLKSLKKEEEWSQQKFDQIAEATEALYSLLEGRAKNREEAELQIKSLSPEEKTGLLSLMENHIGFIFAKGEQEYELALQEVKKEG